ncbi:hypothetical protein [Sphingomonas xinjiangensis]|uniref:Uncharacterized protein n=1 Tax=Sphingomonas xinjiangensis TaxID=643568 RepID=A0A840YQS8_9SPHN|nr:hypothetical protein [Sphingomonas xinjiangensis]MBB5711511.1 hypothetical protein [Sphingomonas xinjiangensis]
MKLRMMLYATLSAGLLLGATPAQAQFGGLGKLARKAGIGLPKLQKDPITTSLPDAQWGDPTRDGFVPREPKRSLATLQRTANGGFVLQPGYYSFHDQSYCLHAGTYGPGGGEGYLYAPPLGAAREAVMAIVRNSVAHPEIDQHEIQALLWAIVARAKFEDLSNEHKMVAAQLLTPRQLAGLNRSALDFLGQSMIANNLPRELRQIMQAEADLRRMLATPGTSFAELERVAVLAGLAPQGPGSMGVPDGRWNHHPDGYYVRYLPHGYTNTTVEIWVPQDGEGAGVEFDPATHIAVPGNTARQRLIQSGRPYASR